MVARTLLDLAAATSLDRLSRLFEEAERLGLLDTRTIEQLIERSRGRRGVRALRRLLDGCNEPVGVTRSELERSFLDLCGRSGLPIPAANVFLAGMEVDAVWPERRLVAELDGHSFHNTRAAFERDRVRDSELQVAGYRVLRFTHRRLESEPDAVVAAIRALISQTRQSAGPPSQDRDGYRRRA